MWSNRELIDDFKRGMDSNYGGKNEKANTTEIPHINQLCNHCSDRHDDSWNQKWVIKCGKLQLVRCDVWIVDDSEDSDREQERISQKSDSLATDNECLIVWISIVKRCTHTQLQNGKSLAVEHHLKTMDKYDESWYIPYVLVCGMFKLKSVFHFGNKPFESSERERLEYGE